MITPQLLDYIKTSVASGQSREAITQALVQSGWSVEDINQGFGSTPVSAYSAPIVTPSVPAHSKVPMILGGVVVVIVLAVAGGLIWADQQVKNNEAKVTDVVSPVATTSDSVPVNTIESSTTIATKSAVSSGVKSEIDAYGVDLYTLKQGVTTVNKTTPAKTEIVYTRSGDEIERKVVTIDASGGKSTRTLTISLDAKAQLSSTIKDMEAAIATDCQSALTKECTDSKTILNLLKTECTILSKNEEISNCMFSMVMGSMFSSAFSSGYWSE